MGTGVDRPELARLNSDGSTDTSFFPELRDNRSSVDALALQTDRKILPGLGDGSIVRLNADGSQDPTFDFRKIQEDGVFTAFSDIIVQADGQILVALVMDDLNFKDGRVRSTLMRLNGDRHLANVNLGEKAGSDNFSLGLDDYGPPNRPLATVIVAKPNSPTATPRSTGSIWTTP